MLSTRVVHSGAMVLSRRSGSLHPEGALKIHGSLQGSGTVKVVGSLVVFGTLAALGFTH